MPIDVAYSASGTSAVQHNGYVIVSVQKTGNYKALAPQINAYLPSGTLHSKYTNRFDDTRYYSGDSAS